MSQRSLTTPSLLVTGIILIAAVAAAQDQRVQTVIGNVFLQSATPGTAQSGHANITGTFRAGKIGVGTTTSNGVISAVTTSSYGVYSQASTTGVYGKSTLTTGSTSGGYFTSVSNTGAGVFGWATATTGGNWGGLFRSSSSSGLGVDGWASATSGTTAGVLGECSSPTGYGVVGFGLATHGHNFGGDFETASPNGIGAAGIESASSGNNYGLWGQTKSPTARAVVGISLATSGANVGVYGQTSSSNGYGVYSAGNFGATGTKAFRIDHPLDPLGAFLLHYCSEGPEPLNVYQGRVRTDAHGFAWVKLPDYFESINRNPEYVLTVIDGGDDFVMSKVTREVKNNQFQIRTSRAGTLVSWEVKGIRNDLWVQRNGAPVELQKGEGERGKYQQPELYNQPQERGMGLAAQSSVASARVVRQEGR